MICQKLRQNSGSGWGSLEENIRYFVFFHTIDCIFNSVNTIWNDGSNWLICSNNERCMTGTWLYDWTIRSSGYIQGGKIVMPSPANRIPMSLSWVATTSCLLLSLFFISWSLFQMLANTFWKGLNRAPKNLRPPKKWCQLGKNDAPTPPFLGPSQMACLEPEPPAAGRPPSTRTPRRPRILPWRAPSRIRWTSRDPRRIGHWARLQPCSWKCV